MKEVFELSAFILEKREYPIKLEKIVIPVVFSSQKKAESYIKFYTKDKPLPLKEYKIFLDKKDKILFYEIKSRGVDSYKNCKEDLFYYNEKGKLIKAFDEAYEEEPFLGKTNPKFKPGDLVQFFSYGELKLGVVYAVPLSPEEAKARNLTLVGSDDTYLIDELEGEHDHIPEEFISKPKYKLTIEQQDAYAALKADVLLRIKNKDNRGPKYIVSPSASQIEAN